MEEIRKDMESPNSELECNDEDLIITSSKDEDAIADADHLRVTVMALEDSKAELVACVRDLESRISHLESEKLMAVEDALRKEEVIKSMNIDLNVERGKVVFAEKKKDDEVCKVKEELEIWKNKAEMERVKYAALVMEKDNEIACLKEELVKEREITSQKDDEINLLKEELMTVRENGINDVANLEERTREAVAQLEKENVSLKEELKLARENERELREMLKQEATVDAILREENREKEMKQLKDMYSESGGNINGLPSKEESDVVVRGIDLTEGECSKISWVSATAMVVSSGIIGAGITALCLRHNRQN